MLSKEENSNVHYMKYEPPVPRELYHLIMHPTKLRLIIEVLRYRLYLNRGFRNILTVALYMHL